MFNINTHTTIADHTYKLTCIFLAEVTAIVVVVVVLNIFAIRDLKLLLKYLFLLC